MVIRYHPQNGSIKMTSKNQNIESWNNNNKNGHPNGCHSRECYERCISEGWILNNTFCRHPENGNTVIYATSKECVPCHPRATHLQNEAWTFKDGYNG